MRRRGLLAALPAAVLLQSCSTGLLTPPVPPPARYGLDLPDTGPAAARSPVPLAGAPTLVVEPMRAAPGLASRRMLYIRRPPQLEAFSWHEWVEPPAALLGPPLQRALRASGVFSAVLTRPTAATADWRLETELLHLHQDFSQGPSRVHLSVQAVLVHARTRQVRATQVWALVVAAGGDDPVSGARAAQAAVAQLAGLLAAFCAASTVDGPGPAGTR